MYFPPQTQLCGDALSNIENGAGGYFAGAGTHWHKQALWL